MHTRRTAPKGAFAALNETGRHEYWAALALRHTPGLGARSCHQLVSFFGSAYSAVHRFGEWGKAGVSPDKVAALRSEVWRTQAREEWNASHGLDGEIVLRLDVRFPKLLLQLPDAPLFLYVRGEVSLFEEPSVTVGMVGMRQCSREGQRVAAKMARELSKVGITVVSGMAKGIDREAHVGALAHAGSTIAVLGTGLDVVYPPENEDLYDCIGERGLLVSEFAPGMAGARAHFPIRNRLISGLSHGVLVVEAALRSGSLITARLALEQNRTVYAVPGGVDVLTAKGCQELIRQGAQAVFSAEDIVLDLAEVLRVSFPLPVQYAPEEPHESEKSQTPETLQTPEKLQKSGEPLESGESLRPKVCPAPCFPDETSRTEGPGGSFCERTPSNERTPAKSLEVIRLAHPQMPAGHARLLASLLDGPLDIDTLCHGLELSAAEVSSSLVVLEVQGLVRRQADQRYVLP